MNEPSGSEETPARDVASFAFLSSYPPTQCGIATFIAALGSTLVDYGMEVNVIRVLDAPDSSSRAPGPVIADFVLTDRTTQRSAVRALNSSDVAVIQHEYGLYGDEDGSAVLDVLHSLTVPSIAIVHTVLRQPTWHQVAVLNDVIDSVDRIVVMTNAARQILLDVNSVRPDQISVIPHGAAVMRSVIPSAGSRPLLLTWGLLGPGKGIEWAIDAMALLTDLRPQPLYLIAGRTHPKVAASHGEGYRTFLQERVARLGVEELVCFDDSYRDLTALNMLIHCADAVILPYDSEEQASSGVLVDAVAAGRPVIATSFPHAVELLASDAGIVVDHEDPQALSEAIRRVLTVPGVASSMIAQAVRIAPTLSWNDVSSQYITLANQILHRVQVSA